MPLKRMFFQLTAIVFLLLATEGVSFLILKSRHTNVGFLLAPRPAKPAQVKEYNEIGLDLIDPLCGWAWSDKAIQQNGFEVGNNCAVLRSMGSYPAKPLVIFITGGSTSDITLKSPNWISDLQQIFTQQHVNAVFYCAAVCGYNSWQEFTKLVRDGLPLKPDIHISYSGANDCSINNGYVTRYQNEFYQSALSQQNVSPLLPSTVYLLRGYLSVNYGGVRLKENTPPLPHNFWQQNMRLMAGTAAKNGYRFMGILQPVLGQGNYRQSNAAEADSAGKVGRSSLFKTYYPQAAEYVLKQDTTLFNFTHIFDTVQGQVFVDYCHIDGDYQKTVAQNVFEQMQLKGYLPAR